MTLANNHVYDYGKKGLLSTLDVLDQEGIPYSGAGRNLKDASKIIYYVMNGRKVAFVSATQIERSKQYTKAATETEPGVLKALHPENFKNSRGGSTKQRLCDRRSALGNRGNALSGSVTAASGRTDCTGRSRCDHRRTSAPASGAAFVG